MKLTHSPLRFLPAGLLTAAAVAFTILIAKVDVQSVGPEGSSVGFATLNAQVHTAFGFNQTFFSLSELLGVLPFLTIAFFLLVALVELLRYKSLKKLPRELFLLFGFYAVVLAFYLLFEKLALNFRPVILDGEGLEASYPSSHTLFALTLCGSALLVLPRLFDKTHPWLVKLVRAALALLALAVVFTRLFAGVHWLTDIVGGLLISAALLAWLSAFLPPAEQPAASPSRDN